MIDTQRIPTLKLLWLTQNVVNILGFEVLWWIGKMYLRGTQNVFGVIVYAC